MSIASWFVHHTLSLQVTFGVSSHSQAGHRRVQRCKYVADMGT